MHISSLYNIITNTFCRNPHKLVPVKSGQGGGIKTTKYKVAYSESSIREIDIEANSPEEAIDMVRDGDVDYNASCEVDATVTDVISAEELE